MTPGKLLPPTDAHNLVASKWIFRIKYNSDGLLEHYKARLLSQAIISKQYWLTWHHCSCCSSCHYSPRFVYCYYKSMVLFINLMLRMLFFMAFWLKKFTCNDLLASLILVFLLMCTVSKKLSTTWNNPFVLAFLTLVVFCSYMVPIGSIHVYFSSCVAYSYSITLC